MHWPAAHPLHMRLATLVVLALGTTACAGRNCVLTPCAPPLAATVTVTSSVSGDSVPGAFVRAPGVSSAIPCTVSPGTTCDIPGGAGTYELDIGAPGFQTVHRTVTVSAARRAQCGCSSPDTQHLDVALAPDA